MPRIFVLFTLVSALGAGRLCAQAVPARSADYLFLATASDARATWVNPAGPATAPTASIAAELVFDRQETENVRLAQWTGGFSSRGISFGYQRDQIPGDEANQAFRVGAALPFRRGAVGLAFTFYDSDQTERALDLGLRYRALRQVELGAVLRNIGRPVVRTVELPVTVGIGAGWYAIPSVLEIAGETHIAERPGRSGSDVTYRLGGRIIARTRVPVGVFGAFELKGNGAADRWAVGIRLGGQYRGLLVASGAGSASVDRVSLTALAIRPLTRGR
jgi:hypothetical protein